MTSITLRDISSELLKSKTGIAGILILTILIGVSIVATITIPMETFKQWNNPGNWIFYPKTASPAWLNLFISEKIPEHKILEPKSSKNKIDEVVINTQEFHFDYNYDDFPNDFIYEYSIKYSGSPLIKISIIRPDGVTLEALSASLPYSDKPTTHTERIFSTDEAIKKMLFMQSDKFSFDTSKKSSEDIVFSQLNSQNTLKGNYVFVINFYGVNQEDTLIDSKLIIGGKTFGLMGTDEIRRDLAVGLLWGTPLTLFIGIAVSIGSVLMGLFYGVFAGFKGNSTDEAMMRFNDVIYALPALPFLIILAVTISNSIFLMIGFLMIFGWVGIAKVSRSMALQIKTKGYVEASRIMGQKNSKIILKHIIPQLLPYTFASIAISVPAAITTEAGLSFLGLGDPTFPTWGQILHDANTYGAAARGLWWWIAPPGIMIAVTGLAFVFIGNALDAIVNPKLRKQ